MTKKRHKAGALTAALVLSALAVLGTGTAPAVAAPPVVTTAPFLVAAVSAPSVEFDLKASIKRADEITGRAAATGAKLVTFGELWLPGYPKVLNSNPEWKTTQSYTDYLANSIVVGSPEWKKVLAIAKKHNVHLSIGYAERDGNYLYMGQTLIGPDGAELETRRKIKPSGSERRYFSDAPMEGNLDVAQTALGRIGMLECWEHLRPQSTFPMLAKGENIHIETFPYLPEDGPNIQFWESTDIAESSARMYAITGGTSVVTPGVGRAFIMNGQGVILAQADPGDEFVTATISPNRFGGGDRYSPTSEFSWGVLEQIQATYPEAARVPDPSHGTLSMVPLETAPAPEPKPSADPTPTPSEEPTTAAPESELTDATQGGLLLETRSGNPGQTIEGRLPAAAAGTDVSVWLHSTPQVIARTTISATGSFDFTIPDDAGLGEHKIVVQDAEGAVLGWANFEVVVAPEGAGILAYTGDEGWRVFGLVGLAAAAVGALLLHLHRRRVLAGLTMSRRLLA